MPRPPQCASSDANTDTTLQQFEVDKLEVPTVSITIDTVEYQVTHGGHLFHGESNVDTWPHLRTCVDGRVDPMVDKFVHELRLKGSARVNGDICLL